MLKSRVILIGASNLTRGISTIVRTSQQLVDGPIDFLVAFGHGRSYGVRSSVLYRSLPGIIDCGLWKSLQQREPLPTFALLTDIGNDLLYGFPVEQITSWVEITLDRLLEADATIVITELPIDVIPNVKPWQFWMLRSCLFPNSRITFEEIVERAQSLNDAVLQLAKDRNLNVLKPQATWYGLDPIHIQLKHWKHVWPHILASWQEGSQEVSIRKHFLQWCYLRMLLPEQRWVYGWSQQRQQPQGRLRDGSQVSYY